MRTFEINQLKQFPRRAAATWQGAAVRRPAWIRDERRGPNRPGVALWVAVEDDLIDPAEPVGLRVFVPLR